MGKFDGLFFVLGFVVGMGVMLLTVIVSDQRTTPYRAYLIYEQKVTEWDTKFQKEIDSYNKEWNKERKSREQAYLKERYGK